MCKLWQTGHQREEGESQNNIMETYYLRVLYALVSIIQLCILPPLHTSTPYSLVVYTKRLVSPM